MSNTQKSRNYLYVLLALGCIVGFFLFSNLLVYLIYALFLDVLHVDAAVFAKYAYLAEVLTSAVMILLLFIIFKKVFPNSRDRYKKIPFNSKDALMSIAAGCGISGLSFLWILLAEKIPVLSKSLDNMNQANTDMASSVMNVILPAVIIAPILEELLFRGILFRSLEKLRGGWLPIILSAVIFGAYHMNLVQGVYATVMGIIAAFIYAKTRNLIFTILLHLTNNLIAAIQSFSPESAVRVINIFTVAMIVPLVMVIYMTAGRKVERQR